MREGRNGGCRGSGVGSILMPLLSFVGYWNIVVHGRKHSYRLYNKMLNEALRWIAAIQAVIDSKTPIETPTLQLIRDIKDSSLNPEAVEQTYRRNPILRYTQHPLHSPLLPLPYGEVSK